MTAQMIEAAVAAEVATGIAMGTRVLTLQGALAVEFLEPGDRVITRTGARVLRAIEVSVSRDAQVVTVAAGALGHDRPDAPLCLAAGQAVMLRDWRAQALYGMHEAAVPAARLVDGEFLCAARVAELRLFRLVFDAAEVVYADGVELACAAPALVS